MNLSDMRLMGASTLTAAAVAVVTVVVYTGHVKATSGRQTVTVTPGSTVELQPQAPPREVAEPRPEPPVVGASPAEVQRLEAQLRTANDKIASLTAELAARPADAIEVTPMALEAFRLRGDRNILPDEATRLAIARAGVTKVAGSYKLCVDTSGAVASIKLLQSTRFAAYDRRIEQAILGWTYRPFLSEGKPTPVCTAVTFIYAHDGRPAPVVDRSRAAEPDAPTVPEAGCATVNVDDLLTQAANQYASGYVRAALALVTRRLPASRTSGCIGSRRCTRAPAATPTPPTRCTRSSRRSIRRRSSRSASRRGSTSGAILELTRPIRDLAIFAFAALASPSATASSSTMRTASSIERIACSTASARPGDQPRIRAT